MTEKAHFQPEVCYGYVVNGWWHLNLADWQYQVGGWWDKPGLHPGSDILMQKALLR